MKNHLINLTVGAAIGSAVGAIVWLLAGMVYGIIAGGVAGILFCFEDVQLFASGTVLMIIHWRQLE